MNIEEIMETRERLDQELRYALATMERKNTIQNIRLKIIENQKRCPHFSNEYFLTVVDGVCPYCGFHLAQEERG